jgi:superoxide dismutase
MSSISRAWVAKAAKPDGAIKEALDRDFGSFDRWRDEFLAMGYALGGGSGGCSSPTSRATAGS